MKKYSTLVLIITGLFIAVYLVFLNKINIAIRLGELAASLQELDRNEKSIDHIGLIATYEINKKIYEKRMAQEDADALEQVVVSLVVNEKDDPSIIQTRYGMLAHPGIWLINFNRRILGKKPLKYDRHPDSALHALDVAYYYERNYLFERAIELYDKALADRKINATRKASILLHKGYCYALAGLNDKARKDYHAIMDKYPQESSAITAAILLRYLEGFQSERERILGSNEDPVSMSQDLLNLLAYKQALQILRDAEKNAHASDIPRIKYFMARCYTGLGKPEKAIENYVRVITSAPNSGYARYANRKLLLIGTRSMDNRIIEISKRLNTRLKDPAFDQMILEHKETGGPGALAGTAKIELAGKILEDVNAYADDTKRTPAPVRNLTIVTSDGNTFKGVLLEETPAEIAIQTSIGRINVKRDKITRITPGE